MAKDTKQKPAPVEAMATITEDMALSIAHGCASSTFAIIQEQAAGDSSPLVSGRFWYCRGQQPTLPQSADDITRLATFLVAHDGSVAGEALYIHTAAHVAPRKIIAWPDLTLAERKAFEVFAATLPPLLREARNEVAARRKSQQAAEPPPDAGVWARDDGFGTRPRKSFNDKAVLSYGDN